MKKSAAQLLVLTVVALLAHPAAGAVYRMLTGDYTTINPDWSAYENGWTFDTVESGSPYQPLISTQHYSGNNSIQIQVPTDTSGNKERFEYVIAHATDTNGLHFDNARYCGFAFRLASPVAAFTGSDLFWQGWQGSPWGPPASLKLTSASAPPYTVGLYIRNMATGPDSAMSDVKLWSSAMIQPDTWYAVVIYISPRYTNNNGNIKLWINGTNFCDVTTNIGYDPAQTYSMNGSSYGVLNGLDVKNGMYQPDANNGHTMYFDRIVLADTYAEAVVAPLAARVAPTASSGSVSMIRNSTASVDLAGLTRDAQTPPAQCLYTVSTTNGAASLLADGHTMQFTPPTNFLGATTVIYAAAGAGEDPREFLHYSFASTDAGTNGFIDDDSGNYRDAATIVAGAGQCSPSTNSPLPLYGTSSVQLAKIGTTNAACIARYVSDPAELNLSDSSWTFAGWFERQATTNHDFIFYVGNGDGFGGDGDELQLYGPGGSSALAVQHYNTNNVLDVSAVSAGIAAAGQWHHAALVFQRTNSNAGVLSAYLDGVIFAATNVSWALPQQMPVIFGGHNKTNANVNRWFGGWLDDLVIFTNALNPAEVAALATRTVSQFGGLTATNFVTFAVTNYAPPKLANLRLTNGNWTLSVNGDASAHYGVQASTNLADWTTLWTTSPAAMPFSFSDSAAALKSRFYRVVIGP